MPSFAQNALAGFQIGQYIGNRGVREREQRAREAERMFRELQMVAEIEKLGIANQELKRGIVERAQQDAQWVDLTTAAKAQHTQARAQLGDMAPEPMDFMDQGALQLAGSNPHAQQYLKARQEFQLKQAQANFYAARPEMAEAALRSKEKLTQDALERRGDPLLQYLDKRQALIETGVSEDDPRIVELDKAIQAHHTKAYAPPEEARLVKYRDEAKAAGNMADAEMYQKAIEIKQGKQAAAAKMSAHKEMATTIRQQLRAIDADKKLKPAEKDARKAPLLKQLAEARRVFLGDLEEGDSIEEEAVKTAITRLDKEIADLQVDITKQPSKGLLDFGGRQRKLQDLINQREALRKGPSAPTPTPVPVEPVPAPVPPNTREEDKQTVLEDARRAIKSGAPRDKVIERLRNLGITEEP